MYESESIAIQPAPISPFSCLILTGPKLARTIDDRPVVIMNDIIVSSFFQA